MRFVKKIPKRKYVFMHDKKVSNLRSYNIIEIWSGEVIWVSTLLLLNSTAIFGTFAGEQHLIYVCRW